jgi:hypothetical protein
MALKTVTEMEALLVPRPCCCCRGGKLTQNKDGHHGLWAASSSLVHATE